MRRAIMLAPLAVVLAGCASNDPIVATEDADGRGGVVGHTWVLRLVDGAPLPARVQESGDGYAELLADTLRFDGDTARESGATRIVAHAAPPAVDTVPRGAPHRASPAVDTVYTNQLARAWRLVDGQVRIGEPPCGTPEELILCALPDTGRVRGDTLVLATAYAGAARRAYVRLGAP